MSKQEPMLMESPLTKRVFVVTSYKDKGNGIFEARQKYDVTEQFDALAKQRSGTCNPVETEAITYYDEYVGAVKVHVMECDKCGGTYEHVNGDYEYCPRCRAKVVERWRCSE